MDTPVSETHPKYFFIVEGPAGAGKTKLTQTLEEQFSLTVIRSSLGARQFEAMDASVKSSTNDYGKLIAALGSVDSIVLVERLYLSQVVYGSLRGQSISKTGLDKELARQIRRAAEDLNWRSGKTLYVGPVFVNWILLMPEPTEIDRRRRGANRQFPWTSQQEYDAYRSAASILDGERFYTDGNNLGDIRSFIFKKTEQQSEMPAVLLTSEH